MIISEHQTPSTSKVFLNMLSQIVVPKLTEKAIDLLDKNTNVKQELPTSNNAPTITNPVPVTQEIIKKDTKVIVNLNFYINDPEHKIDPSTYVPIKFI